MTIHDPTNASTLEPRTDPTVLAVLATKFSRSSYSQYKQRHLLSPLPPASRKEMVTSSAKMELDRREQDEAGNLPVVPAGAGGLLSTRSGSVPSSTVPLPFPLSIIASVNGTMLPAPFAQIVTALALGTRISMRVTAFFLEAMLESSR
jgi:hypothetical protein